MRFPSWFKKRRRIPTSKGNGVATTTTTSSHTQQAQSSTTATTSVTPSAQGISALPPAVNTHGPSQSRSALSRASDNNSHNQSEDLDFWARAYEILQDREPELMGNYKKYLASLQDDTDSFKATSVELIVSRLISDREKKQWRLSLLGKNIVVRQQVERLAKFLRWADPLIMEAAKSQPYTALAWSGASLLLSVRNSREP